MAIKSVGMKDQVATILEMSLTGYAIKIEQYAVNKKITVCNSKKT